MTTTRSRVQVKQEKAADKRGNDDSEVKPTTKRSGSPVRTTPKKLKTDDSQTNNQIVSPSQRSNQRGNRNYGEIKGKVATAEDAARLDKEPPLDALLNIYNDPMTDIASGESVVYWMRMEDMRLEDNRALSLASSTATKLSLPLVVLFVISPGDYEWHDRGPHRIDFMLRNLRYLKARLDSLNIPLQVVSFPRRLAIPRHLIDDVFLNLGTTHVFANIEYEVDELRRDIAVVKRARNSGIDFIVVHDRLAVPPGKVLSQQGRPMSVYSPWQRTWARVLAIEPELLDMSPLPKANDASVRQHSRLGSLFTNTEVPEYIEGFQCDDREKMAELWPEGTDKALEILDRFLHSKARSSELVTESPLHGKKKQEDKDTPVRNYLDGRNRVDGDNSSRLSPYLASGVISARMVLNAARNMSARGKLDSGRDTGIGMWVQEVAWRDFYNHVMAAWPRVSMGRPFQEKFAHVQWEINEEHFEAWKQGKTGFPIVDAAMRACRTRGGYFVILSSLTATGWLENRLRMVVASFLVKLLMIDWRLGEKYFMNVLIDGDLAANNGGWQWTASTGTDPQPYFRIFNTLTQSEKCDPDGAFIRYWVPELRDLKGKAVHNPFNALPRARFDSLGYPVPIVEHKIGRERALRRYKNVGSL